MNVVAYGGGTNSTAMLIGLLRRSVPVDLILFADTGGERPHTYAYVPMFSAWISERGFPPIQTVRASRKYETLEAECLDRHQIPGIAYGSSTCSDAWKIQAQNKFMNNYEPCINIWSAGEKVRKFVGFHANEQARVQHYESKKFHVEHPLIEWGFGQDECEKAILAEALPLPGKSSCFFCPSMKKREVIDLAANNPELFARAVAMEQGANLEKIKGLGRHWSWEQLVAADTAAQDLFRDTVPMPCVCDDGQSDDSDPSPVASEPAQ